MKICTFNVNSVGARLELLLSWLAHRGHDIDVLCLQEIKTVEGGFPYSALEGLGYNCAVSGQKGYNGVAICSRPQLKDVIKGFGHETWDEQKRYISALVEGVRVINIYAPHGDLRGGDKYYYKLQWYDMLASSVKETLSAPYPTVLLGDLNVTRGDLDVYAPELFKDVIGTMPEERSALERILQSGLVDAFRRIYPDRRQFTWWDYIGGAVWKNEGLRLDYVLLSDALLPALKDVEVDMWPRRKKTPKPSDHAPVIVTLRM